MNFALKKRHKVILCVTLYQPKINSQLKFKMATKWALCKVLLKMFLIIFSMYSLMYYA